ncbi:hypothetical protein GQ55_6G277800 [Panicum hallii var. hallii]|uniref:Uncharacterized protein n=1 Tax=Panicum hallii var. hallii TaxID=1504633 RepID=A0A2T7DAI4_9POAL|nr:hypothetical protein GQ55_6G277800 [Panicum hallii var. hallii]
MTVEVTRAPKMCDCDGTGSASAADLTAWYVRGVGPWVSECFKLNRPRIDRLVTSGLSFPCSIRRRPPSRPAPNRPGRVRRSRGLAVHRTETTFSFPAKMRGARLRDQESKSPPPRGDARAAVAGGPIRGRPRLPGLPLADSRPPRASGERSSCCLDSPVAATRFSLGTVSVT